MKSRMQLSLFAPEPSRSILDKVRRLLDPVQHALIPAHVTLCREDELSGADAGTLRDRFFNSCVTNLTLTFGPAERFSDHGILLPCVKGAFHFDQLRRTLLNDPHARQQQAHLTLAHPRNERAPGNSLENASSIEIPLTLVFNQAVLIRQHGTSPWEVVDEFEFPSPQSAV